MTTILSALLDKIIALNEWQDHVNEFFIHWYTDQIWLLLMLKLIFLFFSPIFIIIPNFVYIAMRNGAVVGWTKHRTQMYLLHPFVYRWCSIWGFYAILFVYCLWNCERQLDLKVPGHHHGIFCKHFGKFIFALFIHTAFHSYLIPVERCM